MMGTVGGLTPRVQGKARTGALSASLGGIHVKVHAQAVSLGYALKLFAHLALPNSHSRNYSWHWAIVTRPRHDAQLAPEHLHELEMEVGGKNETAAQTGHFGKLAPNLAHLFFHSRRDPVLGVRPRNVDDPREVWAQRKGKTTALRRGEKRLIPTENRKRSNRSVPVGVHKGEGKTATFAASIYFAPLQALSQARRQATAGKFSAGPPRSEEVSKVLRGAGVAGQGHSVSWAELSILCWSVTSLGRAGGRTATSLSGNPLFHLGARKKPGKGAGPFEHTGNPTNSDLQNGNVSGLPNITPQKKRRQKKSVPRPGALANLGSAPRRITGYGEQKGSEFNECKFTSSGLNVSGVLDLESDSQQAAPLPQFQPHAAMCLSFAHFCPPFHLQPPPDASRIMSDSSQPRLPTELIDEIVELLPVHVAVALRRKTVLRQHILNGRLRRQLRRALKRFDVDALEFFAGFCPQWNSTCPEWDYVVSEPEDGDNGWLTDEDDYEEEDSDEDSDEDDE
ncbi:hypothetical protein BDK51DRAFT_38863 [Blyttiomyces helicus]|uniref:Uncharacterized protein n=1 Tax=Blyttiomyces helicus TaxID=388810 RepID=A0A4P9WA05_9FUNG|nr:hypothetical protein BDK51DRAFT_38863 [Blyttiomyces helicus]|eukprot:RKO89401.1 hypothetical protein BDK51DRAFT_38863 [Blyttiomyces helicus]